MSATRIICSAPCNALSLAAAFLLQIVPAPTAAQQRLAIGPGRSLICPAHSKHCILHGASRTYSVFLPRDDTTLLHDTATFKLVATLPSAAIFIDSYSSRPAGSTLCQAGTESFLRILSFSHTRAAFVYSTKLESCIQNSELALDGVTWDALTHRLHIHWLSAPTSHQPLDTSFILDDAGHIR